MEERFERYLPDMEAFHHGMRTKSCFVCEIVAGKNELPQHFVYEDATAIAFLDAYPRAYAYTLVVPREHREQATWDFTLEEYLDPQLLTYRVREAVREEVGAEHVHPYTFGSNQGFSSIRPSTPRLCYRSSFNRILRLGTSQNRPRMPLESL